MNQLNLEENLSSSLKFNSILDHTHEEEFLQGLPCEFLHYTVILLNCFTFLILRKIVIKILPVTTHLFFNELLATLELCSDCAELGVIYERHGLFFYGLSVVFCYLWWCNQFGEAEACPNSFFEDWFLNGLSLFRKNILIKFSGQLLGAYLTANYLNCIWCFHLTEQHKSHHMERCATSLQITMFYGALIEAIITFISRYVYLHSERWDINVANYTNSVVTSMLCMIALDTSGGYFNPILATALTLNCEGESLIEHFVVYWLGSILGSIVARWFFILKLNAEKLNPEYSKNIIIKNKNYY